MSVSVLTESHCDGMLLTMLLAEGRGRHGIEVGVVTGLSPSYSVARTILAVKRIPVAVAIDANSPEPEVASERKHRSEAMLGDSAGGVPFRVVVAVPEWAILFSERPDPLRRVFGPIDEHLMELAQLSLRRAIGKLAPGETYDSARFRILRAMDADDVRALRETDLIRDLLGFIESASQFSKRPAISRV